MAPPPVTGQTTTLREVSDHPWMSRLFHQATNFSGSWELRGMWRCTTLYYMHMEIPEIMGELCNFIPSSIYPLWLCKLCFQKQYRRATHRAWYHFVDTFRGRSEMKHCLVRSDFVDPACLARPTSQEEGGKLVWERKVFGSPRLPW